MNEIPPRRRGGATFALVVDLVRDVVATRNWLVGLVIAGALIATLMSTTTQVAIPWVIYAGL